jgi:hypothetical protein
MRKREDVATVKTKEVPRQSLCILLLPWLVCVCVLLCEKYKSDKSERYKKKKGAARCSPNNWYQSEKIPEACAAAV